MPRAPDPISLTRPERSHEFAEFGVGVNEKRVAIGAPKRPYTAPTEIEPFEESPNPLIRVARREGFEPPTLRFEERRKGKK